MIQISPKVFFFDFDGVVVNSERHHMLAALGALDKFPDYKFTEDHYFEKLLGFDDVGLFEHLWKEKNQNLNQEDLDALMIEKNRLLIEILKEQDIFFPGVLDFIASFGQNNIPIAVVSGALHGEIVHCLKRKDGLLEKFDFIIGADDVKRSKPDPESYETAYHRMLEKNIDLNPEDCWVIEDSPTGIESAKGAGLNVVGITNSVPTELLSQADHIVSHYSEIQIV